MVGDTAGHDAVVVGAGPNGLAAAIVLARAGHAVLLLEAGATVGGGLRTAPQTLPGFAHDICASVHPMGIGSPFLRDLGLAAHGLEWIQPEIPLAHPLGGNTAVALHRDLEQTCAGLGADGESYRRLMEPIARAWRDLAPDLLGPVGIPRHPVGYARFGLIAIRSARSLACSRFRGAPARALFAGLAGHGGLRLEDPLTAGFALTLGGAGHANGWPLAKGGSQRIADALAAVFRGLGGEIRVDTTVRSGAELPPAAVVLFDVTPRQLLTLGGRQLPASYRRKLSGFRYGPGVFKLDWALNEPIPWQAEECRRAATVHLGGTMEEISASERAVWRGRHHPRPYVILVQPTVCDPGRAPPGGHIAWAYCHVANGSSTDMTGAVESQIERFAPGFRECILARSTMPPARMEEHNPNYVGGDISGGLQDLAQTFFRPVPQTNPYATPVRGWYLCSSSTPPGGGVHGMCGYHAARTALKDLH